MSESNHHFRKLERMYETALTNRRLYEGIQARIEHEKAEVTLRVDERYLHAANSLHGSVYFKMLDDAAFFAVNSVVEDVFVFTVSFNIQFLRPVTAGVIKSYGELKFKSNNLFIADSALFDENGKLAGRGSGSFMRSKVVLSDEIGYK